MYALARLLLRRSPLLRRDSLKSVMTSSVAVISRKDVTYLSDEEGHFLTGSKKALKRWRNYFEEISTVEFPYPVIPSAAPTLGPVQKITMGREALKKMRPCKATVPDDMAVDQ
ncbi:unnamed protein product [Heligmosomoides polygyrus]|uniref:PH domain-containing protein n=1 Tax=Heligmosomoides polygyrus TaxID=6339 RepID=A0A3P8ARB5_HELPZ|nr:unnamed protein product [Heligmosomoides polygyrus]